MVLCSFEPSYCIRISQCRFSCENGRKCTGMCRRMCRRMCHHKTKSFSQFTHTCVSRPKLVHNSNGHVLIFHSLLFSPSSRLFTATMLWFIAGPSLYSYLQRALGTPHLSILPTLLGLRLAFDLQFDSLNPFPSLMAGSGASNNDE